MTKYLKTLLFKEKNLTTTHFIDKNLTKLGQIVKKNFII